MPITIHPPINPSGKPEDITVERGNAWLVGPMGSLEVIDSSRIVVATFAGSAWAWVEQS